MEFSSNLSAIYTKWCAQTFRSIFGLFAIFDRNFAKILASPSNENANYVVPLKEQSILKKALKSASKSTNKLSHNICLNYAPHAQADQARHTKKQPIFSPTAGARSSISPKLCMLTENVVTILKGVN